MSQPASGRPTHVTVRPRPGWHKTLAVGMDGEVGGRGVQVAGVS